MLSANWLWPCFRWARRRCRDGERRWRTRTRTFSRFRMTQRPLGSAFMVAMSNRKSRNVKVHQISPRPLFIDGHGGSIVAKYASKHLHKFVVQRPEFPSDIPEALKQVRLSQTLLLTFRPAAFYFHCACLAFCLIFSFVDRDSSNATRRCSMMKRLRSKWQDQPQLPRS